MIASSASSVPTVSVPSRRARLVVTPFPFCLVPCLFPVCLSYRRPLPGLYRALHGVERLLHGHAVAEVRMERLALRQALQELGKRGDECVFVADDMARPPEVSEDGMLHVGHEQIAQPLLCRRLRRVEKLEMVQPLEVEA